MKTEQNGIDYNRAFEQYLFPSWKLEGKTRVDTASTNNAPDVKTAEVSQIAFKDPSDADLERYGKLGVTPEVGWAADQVMLMLNPDLFQKQNTTPQHGETLLPKA